MTETRGASRATPDRAARRPSPSGRRPRSRNPVARTQLFAHESYDELRKAVWPTRTELLTYTTVVLVFVSVIIGLVYGLDLGFAKAVFQVFG